MTIVNSELIELITVLGTSKDERGFCTGENTEKVEIFAGVKSVNRMEYYEALRAGVNASIIFMVDRDDYMLSEHEIMVDGKMKKVRASKIVYDGTEYRIRRTYRNNLGMLEITCEEVE